MRRVIIDLHLDLPDVLTEDEEMRLVHCISRVIPTEFRYGIENDDVAIVGNSSISILPPKSAMPAKEMKNEFESITVTASSQD